MQMLAPPESRGRRSTRGVACVVTSRILRGFLPVHEHTGTLLHRLPWRYRSAPPHDPMDFSAWFEAYLDGAWQVFDPRDSTPRIGRVLMARGRDAVDVPISNTFGPNTLKGFKVWAQETVPVPHT